MNASCELARKFQTEIQVREHEQLWLTFGLCTRQSLAYDNFFVNMQYFLPKGFNAWGTVSMNFSN